MSVLKLINNSWDESTRNLCFVNTSLQMLYSLPEVRSFFVNQHYKINRDQPTNFKICNEVSRIFKSAGQFSISAATLRLLVGCESQNEEICNGSQQDITLFIRLLLQQIEKELTELDGPNALFMNKFWGREHIIKKFINNSEGTCRRCGKLPRSESEDFNFLKVETINTNMSISLSKMIQNSFSERSDIFKMKCSECCPHPGVCPLTGNCQPENAADQKQLIKTPDFLFIHVLRFSNFSQYKIKTLIVPEEILTLPNGDTFRLLCIADHIGDLIRNGHYVSHVKTDQGWIICDDDKFQNVREPVSPSNYIFLYCKIHTNENYTQVTNTKVKRKEDVSECSNCRKKVENLQFHLEKSLVCKQVSGLKKCEVNLHRIKVNKYTPTKHYETQGIKSISITSQYSCPNCNEKVTDLEHHFRTSCSKVGDLDHCLGNNSKSLQTKKFKKSLTSKNATLNLKQSHKKQKCKSCL